MKGIKIRRNGRWDPRAEHEFGFAVAYYFSGQRNVTRKREVVTVPVDPAVQTATFRETLRYFAERTRRDYPFLIIDDGSPVRVKYKDLLRLVDPHPLLFVRFERNRGIGAGRNLLQRVLSERCEYVVRFDADVTFDGFTVDAIRQCFAENPDACGYTPCITYFARLAAAELPPDQRWFSGSNCADMIAWRAADLHEMGYADAELRWNVDGDQRLRALAALDKRIYVDRELGGKAPPSGGGGDHEMRVEMGRYIAETRPFIKVAFPKNRGTPRLLLNKKYVAEHGANGFRVGGDAMAEYVANVAWRD